MADNLDASFYPTVPMILILNGWVGSNFKNPVHNNKHKNTRKIQKYAAFCLASVLDVLQQARLS